MQQLIQRIGNLGVSRVSDFHEKRKIQTLNYFNLIVAFFLLVGSSNAVFLKSEYPIWVQLAFFITALFCIYLNYLGKYSLSLVVFTLYINISLFFVNEYYPFESGAYLFYFPLTVTVVLLNNPSIKDKFTVLHFFISILFFLISVFFDFTSIRNHSIPPEQVNLLWYYDVVFSVVCTAVLSFMLNRLIVNQNSEIINHLKQEREIQGKLNASLKEKEILLAEVHHRVKNNLSIIAALVNMQHDKAKNHETKEILNDTKSRILSLSLVHNMLYRSHDLNKIYLHDYVGSLVKELMITFNKDQNIILKENYQDIEISLDKAIPVGLLVNEALTNIFKHAFSQMTETPVICINLSESNGIIVLEINDNGRGISRDNRRKEESESLGMSLMQALTEQLDGKLKVSTDKGVLIQLKFSTETLQSKIHARN